MSARGFHRSTVTRPRLSAAGATGKLISPPAVGGCQGFRAQADCYIPVSRGADLSLPLRKMHQLTMRHLQVSSAAHAGCRESYLVQVASAFLSSQHHQARKYTHKVGIRLKQTDCLVASLQIDEVFVQESNNRCHCACKAAAGGERPALRVSLFETDTGELLFSGLTPNLPLMDRPPNSRLL